MNKKIALLLALTVSSPFAGHADDRHALNQDPAVRARMADVKESSSFQARVDEASEVYDAIVKGSHGKVPESVLKNSRCIAIIPDVVTGALLVGGSHGEGFASCKNVNDVWSHPAPISLNQGSIGLQAGAKSADLVMFFQSKDAVSALKRGNFTLGSDISAVAGSYESNVDTSNAGVVVYSRTEGVFAGASVNGSKIGKDEDDLQRYYDKKVNYTALLEGTESPDTSGYSQKLIKLFP